MVQIQLYRSRGLPVSPFSGSSAFQCSNCYLKTWQNKTR